MSQSRDPASRSCSPRSRSTGDLQEAAYRSRSTLDISVAGHTAEATDPLQAARMPARLQHATGGRLVCNIISGGGPSAVARINLRDHRGVAGIGRKVSTRGTRRCADGRSASTRSSTNFWTNSSVPPTCCCRTGARTTDSGARRRGSVDRRLRRHRTRDRLGTRGVGAGRRPRPAPPRA